MGIRVTAGWRLMLGGVALLGAGAVFASCGGDDDAGSTSGKHVDDAKAAANEELAAEKSGDADTFLKRVRTSLPESEFKLMCDAQTSGGLLIAISPDRASDLERRLQQSGLFYATIGHVTEERGIVSIVA